MNLIHQYTIERLSSSSRKEKKKPNKRYNMKNRNEKHRTHVKSVITDEVDQYKINSKIFPKRDSSVEITKDSSKILNLLSILKKRKEKRGKKAWIPAGVAKKADGYSVTPKIFY